MMTQRMKECLAADGVHNLTKDILRLADDKDCVDAYYDVLLAAELLKERMDEILTEQVSEELSQGFHR